MYKGIASMSVEVPEQCVFFPMCHFVCPFSQVVSQIIHEKSDKIKENDGCDSVHVLVFVVYLVMDGSNSDYIVVLCSCQDRGSMLINYL